MDQELKNQYPLTSARGRYDNPGRVRIPAV